MGTADPGPRVPVSVVVPARDAANGLPAAVASALEQDYPADLEVVLVVGPSRDETRRVAADLAAADGRVRVVDNPVGTTPRALNLGVAEARGDVIVRLDAQCRLPQGYVGTAVRALQATGAGNVGGRQVPAADTGFARAVAAAMRSPVGSGGATYRSGGQPGPAETVFLGVFRREALEAVGGFDEGLLRNQDYELNHRLAQAGWTVWFEPSLAVAYRPRGSLDGLARQYHDYGRFKRVVMRRHPSSIRLRQLAPLAMVVGVVGALLASVVLATPWPAAIVVGGYVLALLGAGAVADPARALLVALALATMHWSWAVGFLRGPPRA